MRILVTGCGISGTVLLTRMFAAFKEVEKTIDNPKDLVRGADFRGVNDKNKVVVRKANNGYIFTGTNVNEEKQIEQLKYTKLVNIIRDGRDVLESKQQPHVAELWIACIEQYLRYKHILDVDVRFENLLTDPDKIQAEIATTFNLTSEYRFSEYPIFVPSTWTWGMKLGHKPRPLDTSRIGKRDWDDKSNIRILKRVCRGKYHRFNELIHILGYASN